MALQSDYTYIYIILLMFFFLFIFLYLFIITAMIILYSCSFYYSQDYSYYECIV